MIIQMVILAALGVSGFDEGRFIRGDANYDGKVDISDAITIWQNIMNIDVGLAVCPDAGDANDDGGINIQDPLYLLNFLFSDGPPPPAPFTQPGYDRTFDQMGCD